MPTHTYRNLIFTKHAHERLSQRSLQKWGIWETVQNPDKTKSSGSNQKFIRNINGREYHVVAKQLSDQNKFLIISLWVRGEDDKLPIVWQLLRLPFIVLWKIIILIFRLVKKLIA